MCTKFEVASFNGRRLDELTVEHVVHSHPVLIIILAELFNLVMATVHVPYGFRLSYTVPLPKEDIGCMKNSVNNYRAISISPVLSKIFEQCILDRYSGWLCGTVVERRSLTGELSLSCARPVDDG